MGVGCFIFTFTCRLFKTNLWSLFTSAPGYGFVWPCWWLTSSVSAAIWLQTGYGSNHLRNVRSPALMEGIGKSEVCNSVQTQGASDFCHSFCLGPRLNLPTHCLYCTYRWTDFAFHQSSGDGGAADYRPKHFCTGVRPKWQCTGRNFRLGKLSPRWRTKAISPPKSYTTFKRWKTRLPPPYDTITTSSTILSLKKRGKWKDKRVSKV